MCLITTQKEVKIAEEDIICYKIVEKYADGSIGSPFNPFSWSLDKLEKAEIIEIFEGADYLCHLDNIDEKAYSINGVTTYQLSLIEIMELGIRCFRFGFHSAKTKERFNNTLTYKEKIIAECIIPKGSEYYENNNDLMISNQIIMKRLL